MVALTAKSVRATMNFIINLFTISMSAELASLGLAGRETQCKNSFRQDVDILRSISFSQS